MSEFRKGQKVRVTYEAIYDGDPGDARGWLLGVDDEKRIRFDAPRYATIEPIEDLRPGDVVLDAEDMWLRRGRGDGLWQAFSGSEWADDVAARPFKLHFRDGQPVAS